MNFNEHVVFDRLIKFIFGQDKLCADTKGRVKIMFRDKLYNKKISIFLLCLLLISFSNLLGCGGKSPAPSGLDIQKSSGNRFPLTITDDLGRKVTLKAEPARLISVSPSHTEILFALGLGERVVGVTKYCNYPAEAQSREIIGGFSDPNLEKIVAMKPDLVLATTDKHQNLIQGLDNAGVPVLAFSPNNIDEILKTIMLIGQATGSVGQAEVLTASLKERTDAVIAKVKNIPEDKRPRVYYELYYAPLMSVGPGSLMGELIEKAGGKNVAGDAKEVYPQLSEELIISRNPQVMLNTYTHGIQSVNTIEQIAHRQGWEDLSFIKSGRIYTLNADLTDRSGPRVAEALESIAQVLYPELFGKTLDGK